MLWFTEALEQITAFLDRGGWVLYLIMATIFLIWFFLFERSMYLRTAHKVRVKRVVDEWEERHERTSWHAHQIRQEMLAGAKMALDKNMGLIKALIAMCPLFGLLGTVTGMIEVFEVMSLLGGGNPRAMASGISKATMPTMAGMVGAIIGVLGLSVLERMISAEKTHVEDKLTFDH